MADVFQADFIKTKMDQTKNGYPRVSFCFAVGSQAYEWVNLVYVGEKSPAVVKKAVTALLPEHYYVPELPSIEAFRDWYIAAGVEDVLKAGKYRVKVATTSEGYKRVYADRITVGA